MVMFRKNMQKGAISFFGSALFFTILFVGALWFYFPDIQAWQDQVRKDRVCMADADCVPFVFECGYCPDASFAIHKDFIEEYEKLYSAKCSGIRLHVSRSCASDPKGTGLCVDERCVLVK